MVNLGAISFSIGALAHLALLVLLITNWRGRLTGTLLTLAVAGSLAWTLLLVWVAIHPRTPLSWVFLGEVVRDGLWILFMLRLLATYADSPVPRLLRLVAYVLVGLWGLYALALSFLPQLVLPLNQPAGGFVHAGLSLSILALLLVEQLYRNAYEDQRWRMKLLCIGLGALFTYDLFLYSVALLFHGIQLGFWDARGLVAAAVVPMITLTVMRNPDWSLRVFPSHRIAFYTTSLVAVGVYLLLVALGGYYVRQVGGTLAQFIGALFVFSALLLLLVLGLSGRVRARIKVFIGKHFFPYKYDYRDEWLKLIRVLSSARDGVPLPVRAIRALAQIVESPGGVLWMREEGSDWQAVAEWNLRAPTGGRLAPDAGLVRFLQRTGWVIDLDEFRQAPERYPGLELPSWLLEWQRAWLLVPAFNEDRLIGILVLDSARAPWPLAWEDHDLLKTVGQQIGSYLGQFVAGRRLAEAEKFEAYNRLTAYIMHDLKNVILQLSLIVRNATKHRNNPAFFETVVGTVDNAVSRMQRLLSQLRRQDQVGRVRRVELMELVRAAVQECSNGRPVPEFGDVADGLRVELDPERMRLALGHVLRNAQDATPADGRILVSLRQENNWAVIEVKDTGCGMDEAFVRHRLFRPFDSTKGSKGMGIGANQVRDVVRQAGGSVRVESQPGVGTRFRLRLPLAQAVDANRQAELSA